MVYDMVKTLKEPIEKTNVKNKSRAGRGWNEVGGAREW
jgi:hypothetical protein